MSAQIIQFRPKLASAWWSLLWLLGPSVWFVVLFFVIWRVA